MNKTELYKIMSSTQMSKVLTASTVVNLLTNWADNNKLSKANKASFEKLLLEVQDREVNAVIENDYDTLINNYIKPKKTGGGVSKFPPIVNPETGLTEYYCRYYQAYVAETDIVMSKGKSKGYSKKAIAVWNKTRRYIANLKNHYLDIEDVEQLIATKARIKELEKLVNQPSFYRDETGEFITVDTLYKVFKKLEH